MFLKEFFEKVNFEKKSVAWWKELNVEYANNPWLGNFWEQSGMEL